MLIYLNNNLCLFLIIFILISLINQINGDSPRDRPELLCMNFKCICPAFYGYNDCTSGKDKKIEKCVRKELRMLTDEERTTYFDIIKEMKNYGDYDYCSKIHKDVVEVQAAHLGPAFLPWNREFLKQFEYLIRLNEYYKKGTTNICLPYWDSTLDGRLPKSSDSILFTDLFFGTTNSSGFVKTGPFADWEILEGDYLKRNVGRRNVGQCYSEEDIKWVMNQTDITNILAFTRPRNRELCPYKVNQHYIEFAQGMVHTFIGGHMSNPFTSANDPIFYNHHCFVDLIWEEWRQSKQEYNKRPVEYPPSLEECALSLHFKDANMSGFFWRLKNIDGCSNEYTDNLYEYAPRPTCSEYNKDCGSKYLFCDLSHDEPHCAAKVKLGGNCEGFNNGEQVCYEGNCVGDVCVKYI